MNISDAAIAASANSTRYNHIALHASGGISHAAFADGDEARRQANNHGGETGSSSSYSESSSASL